MDNALQELPGRFPQLQLPIREKMRADPAYSEAVLRGEAVLNPLPFPFSPGDSLSTAETPAGRAEILYLTERETFIRAYRALAYRCEPKEIPDAVGAVTLRGLIDWGKIRRHRAEYLAAGGEDWAGEFRRFTSEKQNYQSTLILLSRGEYSHVPAQAVGLDRETWLERSLTIRKYHELTHFVCRSLFPDRIDAIRDEVLADLIGIVAAFGSYDAALARRFLGIADGVFCGEGRLSHYAGEDLSAAAARAEELIEDFSRQMTGQQTQDVFEILLDLF